MRLAARGTQLIDSAGRRVVLQGVSMHLEFYMNMYGNVRGGSSALDVAHLRRSLPAANAVRLVGLLWKDSIKRSDGVECSTEDAARGYLDPTCMRYLDALVRQLTEAGFWVILTARAKYAAGWDPEAAPDIFESIALRRKMYRMWRFVAERYKWTDRIAGYEIMSEPRTRTVSQIGVRDAMRGGCESVHRADPRVLCVVGPRPFYKLWELSEAVLQPKRSNTLYTFDFFVPSPFVLSNTAEERKERCGSGSNETWCAGSQFPGYYECREVYETWWRGKPGCDHADSEVLIDARWIRQTLERHALGFSKRHSVPVHLNQWGVKDEVFDANGRRRYATAVLDAVDALELSSTYWLWREKHKASRDVHQSGVWGFELVRNDGPHEALDARMLATLQAGFASTAIRHEGNLVPCGSAAATAAASTDVTFEKGTHAAKQLTRSAWPALTYLPPRLPASGVECDPRKIEARIDWSVMLPPPNVTIRAVSYPSPPPPTTEIVRTMPTVVAMSAAAVAMAAVAMLALLRSSAFILAAMRAQQP